MNRFGTLAGPVGPRERLAAQYAVVEVRPGAQVMHRSSKFSGRVKAITSVEVQIAGATGLVRVFPLDVGMFVVDGVAVTLQRAVGGPAGSMSTGGPKQTASGSIAVAGAKARVARAARIVVEGVHDAELVEKVWGDDLRIEGVVVERLDGLDNIEGYVREFAPAANRRLGVLVDHLVAGSKEARLVERVKSPHILVTGTPYIDVWAAIRPKVVGIKAWPEIPKGIEWKVGVCQALGVADPRLFWRQLLAKVESYKDLEASVVGAVEQLIDFVTAGTHDINEQDAR